MLPPGSTPEWAQNAFQVWHVNKMAEEEENTSTSNSAKITVEDLNRIITEPAGGFFMMPSDAYNEVFDGIFLSEA